MVIALAIFKLLVFNVNVTADGLWLSEVERSTGNFRDLTDRTAVFIVWRGMAAVKLQDVVQNGSVSIQVEI